MPKGSNTRVREVEYSISFPPVRFWDGSIYHPASDVTQVGKQKTVSEGHSYDRNLGRFSGGGPFYSSLIEYFSNEIYVSDAIADFAGGLKYAGPVSCPFPTTSEINAVGGNPLLPYGNENLSTMEEKGATAISRCQPYNPSAALGQTFVELRRDGLPSLSGAHLWRDRALAVRNAGDEYLNHVYGWEPLVNDIHSAAHVVGQSGIEAERFDKRTGSTTRRGYDFPLESQKQTYVSQSSGAIGYYPGLVTKGTWAVPESQRTVSRVMETKRWFRGAFTSPPSPSNDFWRRHVESGQKARELWGVELNPELVWEVTPWSWAVDWFSNIGDVISNVTAITNAGQVMSYGYVMEETIEEVTVSVDHIGLRQEKPGEPASQSLQGNRYPGPVSSGYRIVTKRRSEANPFGFGVDWEGLSPTQLAITAALGISRFL